MSAIPQVEQAMAWGLHYMGLGQTGVPGDLISSQVWLSRVGVLFLWLSMSHLLPRVGVVDVSHLDSPVLSCSPMEGAGGRALPPTSHNRMSTVCSDLAAGELIREGRVVKFSLWRQNELNALQPRRRRQVLREVAGLLCINPNFTSFQ